MKITIISHAPIFRNESDKWVGYAPYIKEMDLWAKYAEKIEFVCPTNNGNDILAKELSIQNIHVINIKPFSLTEIKKIIAAPFIICFDFVKIWKAIDNAEYIHLRCPGNIGLIACIVQIFFPKKNKSAKYAGNWNPINKQPLSYRFQKWILNNTFLTRNMKVMVYGSWPHSSKNIIPFFTSSYSNRHDIKVPPRKLSKDEIRLIFVGTLHPGKNPFMVVQIAHKLLKLGFNIILNIFGHGEEYDLINTYLIENNLEESIFLEGNKSEDIIIEYYKEAHFLIFLSKSEGWPKVVAEAMWWGCVPITTDISCVSEMLDFGNRGSLIKPDINECIGEILAYVQNPELYYNKALNAILWSRQFTLEKFESEINNLIIN